MKRLIAICLIAAVATSLVSAVPVTDNLWTVSQTVGNTVLYGNDAHNMLDANYGWLNTDAALCDNFQSAETEYRIQWQTAIADICGCFKCFNLFTKNAGTIDDFALIYGKSIAAPYVSIDNEDALLAQHIPASTYFAEK